MRIHADDIQRTLPEGELPEEHGGELVGYSPVPVPYRKSGTGRRVVEALAYLALAIVADPFAYFLLPSYSLSEETLGSLYLASIGFSILSIGILPLVLFIFSLGAVINFLAVMVSFIWRRGGEERFTFRLVYDCTPSESLDSEAHQEMMIHLISSLTSRCLTLVPRPLRSRRRRRGVCSLPFPC